MTDNVATLQGYTVEVTADCCYNTLSLMVKPGTDYDSYFKAWDTDTQEFIHVKGWNFVVKPVEKP